MPTSTLCSFVSTRLPRWRRVRKREDEVVKEASQTLTLPRTMTDEQRAQHGLNLEGAEDNIVDNDNLPDISGIAVGSQDTMVFSRIFPRLYRLH